MIIAVRNYAQNVTACGRKFHFRFTTFKLTWFIDALRSYFKCSLKCYTIRFYLSMYLAFREIEECHCYTTHPSYQRLLGQIVRKVLVSGCKKRGIIVALRNTKLLSMLERTFTISTCIRYNLDINNHFLIKHFLLSQLGDLTRTGYKNISFAIHTISTMILNYVYWSTTKCMPSMW